MVTIQCFKMTPVLLIVVLLTSLNNARPANGFINEAFTKVQKDFQALTRRVTAYHIMVANEEIAVALKRKIREECIKKDEFVVDVFESAANKYSQDDTTNRQGGLLGELVKQGYCQSPILDKACFELPLGLLEGPLKSEYGYHLVLVTERTNCPKLDGLNTKLMQTSSKDVFGTLVPSDTKDVDQIQPAEIIVNQLGFWFLVLIAGGLVSELAEKMVEIL